jgi:hypothetical protein
MATLSTLESAARDLIDASRKADKVDGGYTERQAVRVVFWQNWSAALAADRVARIAAAVHNYEQNDVSDTYIAQALTRLVKEQILRSRVVKGVRLYELNI